MIWNEMGEFMFFFPLRVTPNMGYCVPSRMQKTEEKSFPITIVISLFFLFPCLAPSPTTPPSELIRMSPSPLADNSSPGVEHTKRKGDFFFFFSPHCTSLDHRPLHHLHRSRGKNHRGKTIHDMRQEQRTRAQEHKSTRSTYN